MHGRPDVVGVRDPAERRTLRARVLAQLVAEAEGRQALAALGEGRQALAALGEGLRGPLAARPIGGTIVVENGVERRLKRCFCV